MSHYTNINLTGEESGLLENSYQTWNSSWLHQNLNEQGWKKKKKTK
jgi:hypothetical protein